MQLAPLIYIGRMQARRGSMVRTTARVLLLVGSIALIANALWLVVTSNLTVGMAITGLTGLAGLAWAGWFPRGRWRWVNAVGVTVLALIVGFAGFLAVVGRQDNATGSEDAVIVLGAAVHGSELSRTLVSRLDAALAFHERNPRALIVVSGGQGPQEDLPEGEAMRDYLLAAGVAESTILVEDRATSTTENFTYSKALLDERLPVGYRVVFVTDEFHVFRAGQIAAKAGLAATHVSSKTPWYFWPANYLREEAAILGSWVGVG